MSIDEKLKDFTEYIKNISLTENINIDDIINKTKQIIEYHKIIKLKRENNTEKINLDIKYMKLCLISPWIILFNKK